MRNQLRWLMNSSAVRFGSNVSWTVLFKMEENNKIHAFPSVFVLICILEVLQSPGQLLRKGLIFLSGLLAVFQLVGLRKQ